jgi:hypothetical protein
MNTSQRPEVLREADQVKEHRGDPSIDAVPQRLCPGEQAPAQDPVGPHVPDEGAFGAFVGGAGI